MKRRKNLAESPEEFRGARFKICEEPKAFQRIDKQKLTQEDAFYSSSLGRCLSGMKHVQSMEESWLHSRNTNNSEKIYSPQTNKDFISKKFITMENTIKLH